jgi:uncharacterized membrane protein YfcA
MAIVELILLFLALGFAVGFAGGLFGIGGGIILVPTFIYVFPLIGVNHDVLMHVALGTSVAMLGPTALAATYKQYRLGNLDIDFYRAWAPAVAVGVLLGLALVPDFSSRDLKLIFAVFLLTAVPYLFLAKETEEKEGASPKGWGRLITAVSVGTASILTGTGGSTFTVPALKALGMPITRTIAISSATAPIVSGIGIVGFIYHGLGVPDRPPYALGFVDSLVFLCMVPTIFLGAPLGVRMGHAMNKLLLQRIFGLLILVIALHTLYGLYH